MLAVLLALHPVAVADHRLMGMGGVAALSLAAITSLLPAADAPPLTFDNSPLEAFNVAWIDRHSALGASRFDGSIGLPTMFCVTYVHHFNGPSTAAEIARLDQKVKLLIGHTYVGESCRGWLEDWEEQDPIGYIGRNRLDEHIKDAEKSGKTSTRRFLFVLAWAPMALYPEWWSSSVVTSCVNDGRRRKGGGYEWRTPNPWPGQPDVDCKQHVLSAGEPRSSNATPTPAFTDCLAPLTTPLTPPTSLGCARGDTRHQPGRPSGPWFYVSQHD